MDYLVVIGFAGVAVLALSLLTVLLAISSRNNTQTMSKMKRAAAIHAEELKEQTHNARVASQTKSDFLARMSHEIRTPLNTIIGMTKLAQKSTDTDKVNYYLSNIEASSGHLLGIVNDILDFSKMESNKIVLEKKLFSLKKDINFVASMFAARCKEKGLELTVDAHNIVNDGIITDSLRLNQVLMNLLSNAVKFTDIGSVRLVATELYYDGSEAVYRFSISDTGIGIDPLHVSKLFTSFTQAGVDTTRLFGGTGLGLAISKNLVSLLGGDIDVDTEPGRGSNFSFTVRAKAKREAVETPTPISAGSALPDLGSKSILVVDDVELNREIIAAMLEDTGAYVEQAADGKQALNIFSASADGHFDLVFMDIQMPIMDGYDSAKAIRALDRADAKSVKIIAVSAFALDEDIKRAKGVGMDDYLVKPIDMDMVLNKIGGWFEIPSGE